LSPARIFKGCTMSGASAWRHRAIRAVPKEEVVGPPPERTVGVNGSYLTRILPLAAGTFAVGTGLLVIQGILPEMARDLGVSVGAAGQLVTVFALTYAVSAPLLSAFGARFDRRRLLVAALLVFAFSNLAAALSTSIALLVFARVVAALASALYTPNASVAGAGLAPPEARGRALALVFGGLSVATVLGVPIGTLLGGFAGWRATFLFVAFLGAAAAAWVAIYLPAPPPAPATNLGVLFGMLRRPRVAALAAVTALTMSGTFLVFSYIAPLVGLVAGGGTNMVAAALLLFGVFAVLGNFLGGFATDRVGPRRTLVVGLSAYALSLGALWVLANLRPSGAVVVAAAGFLAVWGVSSWAFNPPQQQRLLEAAPDAGGLALSLNASALYLGLALGSAVGGYVLALGQLGNLPLFGALFVAGALLFMLLADARTARRSPPGTPAPIQAATPGGTGPPADCVAPCGPMPATGPPKAASRTGETGRDGETDL
jgi:DHA1 family inner membrane transport protein